MADPRAEARELCRDVTMRWMSHLGARVDVDFLEEWLDFAAPLFAEAITRTRVEGRRAGLQTSFDECTAVLDDDGQPDVVLGVALCQSRIGACLEAEGVTMPKVQPHGMQCGACSADNCADCSGWCFCRECGGDK